MLILIEAPQPTGFPLFDENTDNELVSELPFFLGNGNDSPLIEFDRDGWSHLAAATPLPLTQDDIVRLRGLGDPIDIDEVNVIYRPLTKLLNLYIHASRQLYWARGTFLGDRSTRTPYVIGVAGSVAVGKSTFARVLTELLARWPDTPSVELLTTDGFLYPNAELERRGILGRKGFPESYDRRALLRFLAQIKAGREEVSAPVYSHLTYDIVPGEKVVFHRPDVLVVEGLNVLQPAHVTPQHPDGLAVSDFFDFSIYLDAEVEHVRQWYIDRFLELRQTAFAMPQSYFHQFATLSDDEAIRMACSVWDTVNAPNLVENIAPTRSRATLTFIKDEDHRVKKIRLRKI